MKHFVCRIWHRIIRGKKVQTLYYVQEDLTSREFFAVVRISWKQDGRVIAVQESVIETGSAMADELPEFIGDALGCDSNDIAVICPIPASTFRLEQQ